MLLRLRLQLLLLVSVCVSLAYSSTCGVSSVPSSASSPSPANCGWAGYDFSALADVDVYSTDNDGHMNVFRLCSAVAEPACPALSQLCVWPSPTTLQSTSAVCPAVFAPLSSNASYLWSSTPNAVHVTAYAAQPLYCAAGLPMVTYITLQCNSQAGTVAAENVTIVATNSSADCACQVNVTIQTSLACGTPYFASSSSSGVSSLSATSSLGSSGGSPGSGSSSSNPNPASEMTAVLTTLNAPWGSRQQGGMYVVPSSRPATTVQLSNLTRAVSASHSVTSAVMVYGGFNPTTSQPCNDVWYSADAGVTFSDVVQQNGGYNSQAYGPATCQDIVQQILYSITGDTGAQAGSGQREGTNTVWSSTDLGQSWNAVDATFPGRTNTVCVVDSQSRIFVMAGKQPSNNGDAVSNDVWMGTLKAVSPTVVLTWTQQTASAPFVACDGPIAATYYSPQLQTDVLYMSGGYGYNSYFAQIQDNGIGHNEVWASLDQGLTWTLMTSAAFPPRYHARMMASPNGVLAVLGGSNAPLPTNAGNSQGSEYILNDFWVSLDGGYTWGMCSDQIFPLYGNVDASQAGMFSKGTGREDPLLQMDSTTGYVYMGSGLQRDQSGNGQAPNDLFVTSISLFNITALARACGQLTVPAAGIGLLSSPVPYVQETTYTHTAAGCTAAPFGLDLSTVAYDLMYTSTTSATTWIVNLCQPVSDYMCDLLAPNAAVCSYATCNPWSSRSNMSWYELADTTANPSWYITDGVNATNGIEYTASNGQKCGTGSFSVVVRLVCDTTATSAFIQSVDSVGCKATIVVHSTVSCQLHVSDCPSGCCGQGYDLSALNYDMYGYDSSSQVWGFHMCGSMSSVQCSGNMLCMEAACQAEGTYAVSAYDSYGLRWSYINGLDYTGGIQFLAQNGAQCNSTSLAVHIGQFVCDPTALHPYTFTVQQIESCLWITVVHTALLCSAPSLASSAALAARALPYVAPAAGCSFAGYDLSPLSTFDMYGTSGDYLYVSRVCGAVTDAVCGQNYLVASSSVCQINTHCTSVNSGEATLISTWNPSIADWSVVSGGLQLQLRNGVNCPNGPATLRWIFLCDSTARWPYVASAIQESGQDECFYDVTIMTDRVCPSAYNATLAALLLTASSSSSSSTGTTYSDTNAAALRGPMSVSILLALLLVAGEVSW